MPTNFTDRDREQLASQGISLEEAARQLALLRSPPPPANLDRPCTVGDGIVRLGEDSVARAIERFEQAAARGRITKMVPASGAASRMFRSLLPILEHAAEDRQALTSRLPDAAIADAQKLISSMDRFAFRHELEAELEKRGRSLSEVLRAGQMGELVEALLGDEGLALASLPKGLIPFHHTSQGARTPFAEHLVEALATIRDTEGRCRLHFTVSPEHRERCTEHIGQLAAELSGGKLPNREPGPEAHFAVSYSEQSPATDTLALGEDHEPFRLDDGSLLLRPGGHGALLRNLQQLGADVVMIKNIDNVQPDRVKPLVARWKKLLGGHLLELESQAHALLGQLDADPTPEAIEAAIELIATRFDAAARDVPESRRLAYAVDRLDRPLRVCGVVPASGEPGGGPFWAHGARGCSPQIVEGAQISSAQRALLAEATHFNPVDLVCAVRNWRGEPFELHRYVDPSTAFVTEKSFGGRKLRGLEHPGLWNGAMAGWNTVFVEVPAETFSPVKTVFDLLRPEHQPEEQQP